MDEFLPITETDFPVLDDGDLALIFDGVHNLFKWLRAEGIPDDDIYMETTDTIEFYTLIMPEKHYESVIAAVHRLPDEAVPYLWYQRNNIEYWIRWHKDREFGRYRGEQVGEDHAR